MRSLPVPGPILLPFLLFTALLVRAEEKAPNILFIFADDQAFNTIHALGNEEIETPNLDRLVREGTAFSHTYNMGGWGGAICVASRTMLMTGRSLWHAHGDYNRTDALYREQGRLWPQLLEKRGYDTYFSGKWHLKADAARAFTVARHIRPGMPNQTSEGYNRPLDGAPDPWSPYDPKFGGFWKGGKHWSEILADDGVEYLETAAASEKPFFMYLAFNAPHDPRQSPKEYVDKYPPEKIAIPPSFQPEYPYDIESNRIRDEKLAPFPRTPRSVRVNRQEYYAIITHMDHQIGRMLDALEKSGKKDDTYIFFSADHGLAVGHHGLMGKQNMYDHSVRVPLVVVGPGIEAGHAVDTPVYLQDIMPTTLELAGIDKPDHVDFHSLQPLLEGKEIQPYRSIYGAYTMSQRMITRDGYKLILYPKIKRARLFHLREDPHEMDDLAGVEEHRERVKSLFAELLELQKVLGDELDLETPFADL